MDGADNSQRQRASWLEIDLPAFRNNLRALRAMLQPNTQLMAVVKGNAYGHGAVMIAKTAEQTTADSLAVATVGEGVELRRAGIHLPILVLGHTPLTAIDAALNHQLTLTAHTADFCKEIVVSATGRVDGSTGPVKIHLKVNTGMNRIGLAPTAVCSLLHELQYVRRRVEVEGIYTHFATADAIEPRFLHDQFARFQQLLTELEESGLRPPIAHAANSAATLRAPHTHLDLVRCGIATYGLHPAADECRLPTTFQPVLSWKAQVVQLTDLVAGDTVSYGRTFCATGPMVIATIPVGYADGFVRSPHHWGSILLHGQAVPIVGRVCMDQCMVDVTPLLAQGINVQTGDEVVLIGRQGDRILSAEEVAARLGTINYEVVSRILPRVPRIFVE